MRQMFRRPLVARGFHPSPFRDVHASPARIPRQGGVSAAMARFWCRGGSQAAMHLMTCGDWSSRAWIHRRGPPAVGRAARTLAPKAAVLVRRVSSPTEPDKLGPWLLGIARNRCQECRRHQRQGQLVVLQRPVLAARTPRWLVDTSPLSELDRCPRGRPIATDILYGRSSSWPSVSTRRPAGLHPRRAGPHHQGGTRTPHGPSPRRAGSCGSTTTLLPPPDALTRCGRSLAVPPR
jgi:hypothetical protein